MVVFDSFAGLPAERGQAVSQYHNLLDGGFTVKFRQGQYCAQLEEVRDNVSRYGEGDVVDYIPGFFEDTMPGWRGLVAAVVLDVDLLTSTTTCLRYLWPQLSPGGLLYSQDAHLKEIVDLFTDSAFWRTLGETKPPRFVGLGSCKMVYTRKPQNTHG